MVKWPFVLLAALIGIYLLIRLKWGDRKGGKIAVAAESGAGGTEFHKRGRTDHRAGDLDSTTWSAMGDQRW